VEYDIFAAMEATPHFFEQGQVLLIDKPLDWTSFDVVRKLRRLVRTKKVGHAGTLDPLATGLLILGGNIFGILAPIVTGYVVQSTGSFNMAFVVAGALLALGALTVFLVVRTPIGRSESDAKLAVRTA